VTAPLDARTGDVDRPGPLGWLVIVLGWALMVGAVVGALGDDRLRGAGSWVRWLVGAAVVHDLVVLPLVVATGWAVSRFVPLAWRTPVRIAAIAGAIVAATVWPIARRWGARDDNPSILPLPVGRNLLVLVVLLAVAAAAAGTVTHLRRGSNAAVVTADPEEAAP
jgi:hypothetical protein